MSLAIAFLLDPSENHGQGDVFLRAFVEKLNLGWRIDSVSRIRVRTEVETDRIEASNRRIDILVEGDSFVFAIENKFWAADQDKQLEHYLAHLSKLHSNRCLIYLTPHGIDPHDASISRPDLDREKMDNSLRLFSYRENIHLWLEECRKLTQSPRVWSFLSDLARYIEITFKGVTDVDQSEIVHVATQSPENLSASLKIAFAANGIKSELIRRLKDQLEHELPNDSLEWYLEKGASLMIKHPSVPGLRFKLEFQQGGFNWLRYGISMTKEFRDTSVDVSALRQSLTAKGGKNQGNEAWIWCHDVSPNDRLLPLEINWSNNEQPWNMILSGELAKIIVSAKNSLFELIKPSLTVHETDRSASNQIWKEV